MTAATMTLTEFLLVRIAEDEAVARAASPSPWQYGDVDSIAGGSIYDKTRMIGAVHYELPTAHDGRIVRHLLSNEADANGTHVARHDPARVLAECEAKRHVVRRLNRERARFDKFGDSVGNSAQSVAAWQNAVGYLAAVYADHPDYRDEWKP